MQILTARTLARDGTTRTRTFTLARPTVERETAPGLSRIVARRFWLFPYPVLVFSEDIPARMPDHGGKER